MTTFSIALSALVFFVGLIYYPWLTNTYEQYKEIKNYRKYAYGDMETSLTLAGISRDCMRKKSKKKRLKNRQRSDFYVTAEEMSIKNGPPHCCLPQTSQVNPLCAVS